MLVRSAVLKEVIRLRAGLLALGILSEATGVKVRVEVVEVMEVLDAYALCMQCMWGIYVTPSHKNNVIGKQLYTCVYIRHSKRKKERERERERERNGALHILNINIPTDPCKRHIIMLKV